MEKNSEAIVINKLLDTFELEDVETGSVVEAKLRGNLKSRSRSVLVGDKVLYEKAYDKYMICKILDRKNSLIRPPVANIDNLIITLSIKDPAPDYTLLDKELLLCFANNINPIICVNKIDLKDDSLGDETEYIRKVYSKVCKDILFVSCKKNIGIDSLKEVINGKISAFSGNSGVGKSSIIKAISNDGLVEIGDIARKSKRGRHTTKHIKLYKIMDRTYIVDTPGFSSYEIYNIEASSLRLYYPEFRNNDCDYDDCSHINEATNICAVKRDVEAKIIDRSRYERYVYIYNKLKEEEKNKYK